MPGAPAWNPPTWVIKVFLIRFQPGGMDNGSNAQKLAVLIAILVCAASWLYLSRVLIPHQKAESAARAIPRGNLSDLYPRWLGSRELLLHHRDPYGSDVTREIQVYVAFLLSPTVGMWFDQVQMLFRWMLGVFTLASVPLWLRVVDWRLPLIATIAIALFVFSTFPVVQGMALQQLSLLVAPMIAACVFLLVQGRGAAAGVVLALATIKPQITAPLAGWLLLWSASDFKHRWKFTAALVFILIVLVAAGQLLLPGWIREFVLAMRAYLSYNPSKTLLDGLLGDVFGPCRQCSCNSLHCTVQPIAAAARRVLGSSQLEPVGEGAQCYPHRARDRSCVYGLVLDLRQRADNRFVLHNNRAALLDGTVVGKHRDAVSSERLPGAVDLLPATAEFVCKRSP
jgi:hypothetical protein